MMLRSKSMICISAVSLVHAAFLPALLGQGSITARAFVSRPVNDERLVILAGNVQPAARIRANDRGEVERSLPLEHMLLQLRRSPESEAALDAYLVEQNDVRSPHYHEWLTAGELGERFGPARADIDAVTGWLSEHGFSIHSVAQTGMTIDFSGNGEQVSSAFHVALHKIEVNGEAHIANVEDPSIPEALESVISGVATLNDLHPRPMHRNIEASHFDPRTGSHTTEGVALDRDGASHPDYNMNTSAGTYEAMVPGDLAAIYNLKPLFAAGYSGQGQTIVVIEDTDVYSTNDWKTFRSTFGLASYAAGSFTQEHPGNCTDPGINGADGEAILDAEWASAAAPSAAIVLASCANTNTTFGGLIALTNLINSSRPPRIISISYGESETENGATANLAYSKAYQAAAVEGISIFVSSGDEGASSSDANSSSATHGITVSGLASTPYNVAVGGTDFGDTYAGLNNTYWSSANSSTYASARSYIPEIPWNDSCASQLIATKSGYSAAYGTAGFCNSAHGKQYYLSTASGSGGPSGCATGSATSPGVVSGSCKGYSKPSFQNGLLGNPSDGVRDVPDVSLFAANGVWGHYYVYCYSDSQRGGSACTGTPGTWSGAGGTSFAAPIMAAIQSLVNQKTASSWGNPDQTYYNLAKAEYGSSGNTGCNSSNGNGVSGSCTFYDVRQGDIDVNCTGALNCYKPSGVYGVLSTTSSSYKPAYGAATGWDFATGIGSVNAQNLVNNWGTVGH